MSTKSSTTPAKIARTFKAGACPTARQILANRDRYPAGDDHEGLRAVRWISSPIGLENFWRRICRQNRPSRS